MKFKYLNKHNFINRFLTAWSFTAMIFIIVTSKTFLSKEFAFDISTVAYAVTLISSFLLFSLIKKENIITLILVISSLCYSAIAVSQNNQSSFIITVCVIISCVILYSKIDKDLNISRKTRILLSMALALSFVLFIGISCCLRYLNYNTPCFDFGIFSQMFYNMKESGLPIASCERDELLSHFAVHFSPIFYLLLPVYYLFPSPNTLMIAQCALTALGVIPLTLICKNHKLSDFSTLIFTILYLLYPCFSKSCFFYIHENNFLIVLILFLLYFSEKGKAVPSLIFAFLIMLVKEDAPVYTAVTALYFLFTNKNYKCNLSILTASILYFISVTFFIGKYGDGVMTDRYSNYMLHSDESLFSVIETAVKNPLYVLQQCAKEDKILFLFQMLLPLAFLPFITKKAERLILLIPFVLVNLMPDYIYQHDIGFQYCFGSGALLIYLSIVNFSEIKIKTKEVKLLLTALCCSLLLFSCFCLPYLGYYRHFIQTAEERNVITQAIEQIPDQAEVASSTFILPNLSQRKTIYELETTKNKAEYYVIDLRNNEIKKLLKQFQSKDFIQIYYDENIIAVYQSIRNLQR